MYGHVRHVVSKCNELAQSDYKKLGHYKVNSIAALAVVQDLWI